MKLRRQLLLVSLLTLSLPWAGCQYIQEMESALRHGQSAALTATASAVAARLSSAPALLPPLDQSVSVAREIYAHQLPAAAIVDGYSDDWRGQPLAPRQFQNAASKTFRAQLSAGIFGGNLYLFADISDPSISYHHPGKAQLASGDHLQLSLGHGDASPRVYTLRTSAPGSVEAVTFKPRQRLYQEHRIKGYWRERSGGYQVELVMPLAFAEQGFEFSAVDADQGQVTQRLGTLDARRDPSVPAGRLIGPRPLLQDELAVFTQPGLRLRVLDHHAWQLALAGSIEAAASATPAEQPHWLLSGLYRAILKNTDLPRRQAARDSEARQSTSLASPEAQGRYDYVEVEQALLGQASVNWYQLGSRHLGSAAVPIISGNQLLGAVVAEQSSDALLALTDSAFSRLVVLSMGTALIAGLGLLGYASWLSWRIRRLSRAADAALSGDRQVDDFRHHWPTSRAADEIGELSRSYGDLLGRLQAYTDYLKTLADKLSHELRTPLAVVRSSLDNLEHEHLSAQAGVYTERAKTGAERLSRLLSAMSEASRVEASIQSAERETFPLDEFMQHLSAAYRDIYAEHEIHLTLAPSSTGYNYSGSPDLLAQCLDKLVDNAADFCPPGAAIRLSLVSIAIAKTRHWALRVENQGPLLPEQMREQLFDSLVSLREGPQRGKDGKTHMGLGLHIVRLVANFHAGSVSADNLEDGSGGAFTLRLPGGTAIN